MRKKRFTVAQIGVLKKAEVGVPEAAVIRKVGISEQTFYRWKAKYGSGGRPGSPDGAVARREPAVEAVGGRADVGQDDAAGMRWKKMVKPSRRGPMVERLVGSSLVSKRQACRVLRVPRATYRYRSYLDPRTELRMRILEIAQARVRYGYRKIRVLLNRRLGTGQVSGVPVVQGRGSTP
jgi:putative transposase